MTKDGDSTALTIRVLGGEDIRRLLTPERLVESQRVAFAALGGRTAAQPARIAVPGVDGSSAFSLTARLAAGSQAVNKFGSVNPGNVRRDLPIISALVTVLDADTGRPAALLDGTVLTELRTAAGSALAAQVLAPDAAKIIVVGDGVQGRAHLRLLAHTHPEAELVLWGRDRDRAAAAAEALTAEVGRPVAAAEALGDGVTRSDLVVLCTSSRTPVIEAAWVQLGTTVISIGSFAPDRHEISAELMARCAAVVVDDLRTATEHAGPIIDAVAEHRLQVAAIRELGVLIVKGVTVRGSEDEIVFYNSVGVGVQDAAAAVAAAEAAETAPAGERGRLVTF